MESLLAWGLLLLGLGVVLIVVDIFVPSAGILTILAGVSSLAGVVCLFRYDAAWGLGGLLAVIVLGPMLVSFGLKVWPHTPLGRRIIGVQSEDEVRRRREEDEAARREREAMVGQEGLALTDLRPVGVVEIQGRRHDALAETLFIQAGSAVRVHGYDGLQIKVRPVVPGKPTGGPTSA